MAKSLLEVLRDVSLDPTEQAAFSADPSAYLAQYGYEDVPPDDLSEAFSLVADTLPPDVAQTVTESQVASQFGGEAATEGLATNGEPTFGAGYDAVVPDDGADLVEPGEAAAFDGDLHFGEGVGESHDDPGFGQGGDAQVETAYGYDRNEDGRADDDDQDGRVDTVDDNYEGGFGEESAYGFTESDDTGGYETFQDDDGLGDAGPDIGADDIGSF